MFSSSTKVAAKRLVDHESHEDQEMDAEAAAILRHDATAYDVLGVDPGADANAIKQAYHK